ncbi:MAG: polyprenyl synthetase family protein [Neomegalonema sp.]|nr:polyprenyl synthetase family protein [Neomegalonema sp.]
MGKVNDLIRARMSSQAAPLIPELAAHLIEAGGKRLRPVLTLAAAQLCGYQGEHHIRLAATVEFIHTATLLHDDVVDESDRRRGRASANILWGNKAPVLVGDYLFSRSFQLMVETDNIRVLDILAQASAVIAEGEVLQLTLANTISEDDRQYMQVIRGKTAALFEAATRVGAVIAQADPAKEQALTTYGDALGVAFQLVDDALDYGGTAAALGKNVGDDFREGKATLPVIHAYAQAGPQERAFWERCICKRKQEEGDLEQALDYLRAGGGIERTVARARAHVDEARAALDVFEPSPMRQALIDVAEFVISRAT